MELAVSHHHRRLVLAAAALAVVMVARTAVAGRRPLPAPADTLTVLAHTGGAVRAVAAAGGRAWIGEGSGVSVLDITDPTVPLRLHHTALSSGADVHSLVRRGDYVYAGATDGVHVLRVVSGGDGGSEEGVVATPGTVRGLVVAGERLLISDGAFGLLVAGLDAPERPAVAWGIELEGGAPGPVAVAGDLVLVPGADLVVVRVPAVGPPAVLAAVDLGGAVVGVAATGTDGWAAVSTGDVVGLDLSRPRQPRVQATLAGLPAGRLAKLPPYLLLLGDLRLLDVRRPAQPRDVFQGAGPFSALVPTVDVALAARPEMLLAARGASLETVALPLPTSPDVLGSYVSTWPVADLALGGQVAWVAKGASGLDVLDLAIPGAPPTMVSYRPPGGVWGVAIRAAAAYLSTGIGAQVLDITAPSSPVVRSTFGAQWPATTALAADGARVVAADGRELRVAAVEAGGPVSRGQLTFDVLPDWPATALVSGVAVGPGAAYLAAGVPGVAVFDIGDPAVPRPRGFATVGGAVLAVAYEAGRLVVGADDGVGILDAGEPLAPRLIDFVRLGSPVVDVAVSSGIACAALEASGLVVVDVTASARDRLMARLVPGAAVDSCAVSGSEVVAASAGLIVVKWDPDVKEPPPSPPAPPPTVPPTVPAATPGPTSTSAAPRPTTTEATSTGGGGAVWLPWAGSRIQE